MFSALPKCYIEDSWSVWRESKKQQPIKTETQPFGKHDTTEKACFYVEGKQPSAPVERKVAEGVCFF